MAAIPIQLTSIMGGKPATSSFYHDDTILDLRKRFAKEQGFANVTMYQAFLKLADEKLVRDHANTVEGISFEFPSLLDVQSNDDIWVIRKGKWNLLVKDIEDALDVGTKRNIFDSGFGKFAIVRNKYVLLAIRCLRR